MCPVLRTRLVTRGTCSLQLWALDKAHLPLGSAQDLLTKTSLII